MHKILDTFLSDHGVGDGAPPRLKEQDETTRRELKIIQFLSEKAKSAEMQQTDSEEHTPEQPSTADGDEEVIDGESKPRPRNENVSAERSSVRLRRKKSSRSINAHDAGLLLAISNSSTALPSPTLQAGGSTATGPASPFIPSHSRTPSNVINRSAMTSSPMEQEPELTSVANSMSTSPSYIRLHAPMHTASPLSGPQHHLSYLAQRQVGHDARSLSSSSPAAEDESAQRLLDNWCNNVSTVDSGAIGLGGFDPNAFNIFGGNPGAALGAGPMWNVGLSGYGAPAAHNTGLGLMNPPAMSQADGLMMQGGLGSPMDGRSMPRSEVGSASNEGADFMLWDALVQQIRGGGS